MTNKEFETHNIKSNLLKDLLENKKNEDDSGDDGRDKIKEEQELIEKISGETFEVIKNNPEKMEEIIEGLKKKLTNSVSEEISLSKMRTIIQNIGRSK